MEGIRGVNIGYTWGIQEENSENAFVRLLKKLLKDTVSV